MGTRLKSWSPTLLYLLTCVLLAGIPSIVLGFLGWVVLAPIIQNLGASTGLTAFSGSRILAYMSLPTIFALSGGQKQRLCLARSLVLEPEVIVLDNPTSGLDPISTATVEASMYDLKQRYTIIMVPHSVQQAARVADRGAFLLDGDLVEVGDVGQIFVQPDDQRTEDYVTGRFG